MTEKKNSLLAMRVFEALYKVIGRRTLDSFAIQILKTTIEKMRIKFDCLSLVTIFDDGFSEDGIHATFEPTFDMIDPQQVGEAFESFIHVIYVELTEMIGDDVAFYFITELKHHLGDPVIDDLRTIGVHFERIQTEQHLLHQKQESPSVSKSLPKQEQEVLQYSWQMVSTWKYNNNQCLLYDEQGRLLDTLQLDFIIEEYVERVIESRQKDSLSTVTNSMVKMTEKDHELLEMIRRRDTDIDSVINLLHVSQQKLDTMVQKLLLLEMLQYHSDTELQLTEKGLQYLSELNKK